MLWPTLLLVVLLLLLSCPPLPPCPSFLCDCFSIFTPYLIVSLFVSLSLRPSVSAVRASARLLRLGKNRCYGAEERACRGVTWPEWGRRQDCLAQASTSARCRCRCRFARLCSPSTLLSCALGLQLTLKLKLELELKLVLAEGTWGGAGRTGSRTASQFVGAVS